MRQTRTFLQFNVSQRHAVDALRNLAVRANAGSGKTSVLVERVVQLLAGRWDTGQPLKLTEIVAITFTRKAAAELQDRLREAFAEMGRASPDPAERHYWADRTRELPHAMIGTIDSFCVRILRDQDLAQPAHEGIEPDFEPLDDFDEATLKREAIDRVLNRLSRPEEGVAGEGERARIDACRWWAVHQGYKALTENLLTLLSHPVEPETIHAAHAALPPPTERVEQTWRALPAVRRLGDERRQLRQVLQGMLETLGASRSRTLATLAAQVRELLTTLKGSGQQADARVLDLLRDVLLTRDGKPRSTRNYKPVEREVLALQQTWAADLAAFSFDAAGELGAQEAADHLVLLLKPAHDEYLRLCREANRFDFLTLARRTRDLLRDSPELRRALRERYRYVMVDEFQDTNRLQWEIVSWVVGAGPDGWLDPDRLFIVGDPQQSIYRFRHADVSVFARIQACIRAANVQHGHGSRPTQYDALGHPSSTEEQRLGIIPLAQNYRSLHPVPLLLLNRVFRDVFDPVKQGFDADDAFEVSYQDLAPGRPPGANGEVRYVIPAVPGAGKPVPEAGAGHGENGQTGDPPGDGSPADGPTAEDAEGEPEPGGAEELGRLQVQAVVDQLVSLWGQPKYTAKEGEPAHLGWRDMAVLLPSRTVALTELEKELTARRVPFVVTKGIGFWQRQEVRDLVSLATWLADAGDELALFAVLRSPLGQLTDTACLFLSQFGGGSLARGLERIRRAGPRLAVAAHPEDDHLDRDGHGLDPSVPVVLAQCWRDFSEEGRGRIRRAAERLAAWRQRVDRLAPAELFQRALEESGAYALYAAAGEGERILANLDRLIDILRALDQRSGPGLAHLARWLRRQVEESPKDEQASLAAERDAVQVMTVHAAKGLEFPVVAVLKLERRADWVPQRRLLVKSPWEDLLREDAAALPVPPPGMVAVAVRHPLRPREIYTPRLLAALHNLDRQQQMAESRRLFYVAATRAKERLILAGREASGPGRPAAVSWQQWFEDALGLTAEHKQQGFWEDTEQGDRVSIITQIAGTVAPAEVPAAGPAETLALAPIAEPPRIQSIAATLLGKMRALWREDRNEWWLKYRARLGTPRNLPDAEIRGKVVGTLVQRLFAVHDALVRQGPPERRELLEAMAARLLASAAGMDSPVREARTPPTAADVRAVANAVEQVLQRLRGSAEPEAEIRRLLAAAGEPEVGFALDLGRWRVVGRFDKLLAVPGGWEIVDWNTDTDKDVAAILAGHEPQRKLYALALCRSGQAACAAEAVRVHVGLLQPLRVATLAFPYAELEAFEQELVQELEKMAAYEPG